MMRICALLSCCTLTACGGSDLADSVRSAAVASDAAKTPAAPVQGWTTQSHDPQHTGVSSFKAQSMRAIHWRTPVDLQPQLTEGELFTHYGSPLVTLQNTVIVPVKTGQFDGFKVEARSGKDGSLKWTLSSDYSVNSSLFLPSFGPAISNGRVVMPAAGGTILIRDQADAANGKVTRAAFYGLKAFNADSATFAANVKINTPVTADAQGNLYFGFIVSGPTPIPLQSGLARIGADGSGSWISAASASGDPQMLKVNMNCAPALSLDGAHLYVGVNNFDDGFGYLVMLDAKTLQPLNAALLLDPVSGFNADISDLSSASPTVGPDGDVFFGVLENPFPSNHERGWLLHFNADLTEQKIPGSFGWDDTASIVDASLVKSYRGTSKYLVMTKYNDYAEVFGTGLNQVAILDPNATQPEFVLFNPVMKEVLTVLGPTPDPDLGPQAVREWCINTAAVDPFTRSIFVNSEDGKLYRWDLDANKLASAVTLTGGLGEAYTPTVIGVDGTIYAINRAMLFAIGDDN
jgi:hypothetical protein